MRYAAKPMRADHDARHLTNASKIYSPYQ